MVVVNPNNPSGGTFDVAPLPELLAKHAEVHFLVDEAFVELGGASVAHLVPQHRNLVVTRTFSQAHSLAGFRVGYAVAPPEIADWLNEGNDAYPLARPSQAAALATLGHMDEIEQRVQLLKQWTSELARGLQRLGVRTFPSETYFFLADFAPLDGQLVADRLAERKILVKPLRNPRLGRGVRADDDREARPEPDRPLGTGRRARRAAVASPPGRRGFAGGRAALPCVRRETPPLAHPTELLPMWGRAAR